MAPFATIYSYPGSFRVQRAQVVGAINGLEVVLDPDFKMGETNKTPEFLSKFPLGKVPALECADGFCITEGAAICAHIAASGPKSEQLLGPAGPSPEAVKTRSLIWQWVLFAELELVANATPPAMMTVWKYAPFDQVKYDYHVAQYERALRRVEAELKGNGGKKYLLGDEVSLADVMIAGSLAGGAAFLFDDAMRAENPAVAKYFNEIVETPAFKAGFPEVKKCATRMGAP